MKISEKGLLALFPSLYSRRERKIVGKKSSRNWMALELPRIRVMGPYWSFALKLDKLESMPNSATLDILLEQTEAVDISKGPQSLHQPVLQRAEIDDFWSDEDTAWNRNKESRLSLLAVDTSDGDELLLPLPNDESESGFDKTATTPLILAPFGTFPRNCDFNRDVDDDGGRGGEGDIRFCSKKDKFHLPAARLVAGHIWFTPVKNYLMKLRKVLGLSIAEKSDRAGQIALLPDGFAVAGELKLPWKNKPLSAWFKITVRGTEGGTRQNVLRLWTDDGVAPGAEWQTALGQLTEILRSANGGSSAPQWLRVHTSEVLAPEMLYWPCNVKHEILLSRDTGNLDVGFDTEALMPRLGNSSGPDIILQPQGFTLSGSVDNLKLHAKVDTGVEKSESASVQYKYNVQSGESDSTNPVSEHLSLTSPKNDDDNSPLKLAVPMLSNADKLRDAMGFDEPSKEQDSLGAARLWLYTPLDNGWLHWPFPNATARLFAPILRKAKPTFEDCADASEIDDASEMAAPKQCTAGLWQLQNRTGAKERPWAISISAATKAELNVTLKKKGKDPWQYENAKVDLHGLSLRFNGFLPVTAFSQSRDRILPEPQDRALCATALEAMTPDLLVGADEQMWRYDKGLRVETLISGLKLSPTIKGNGVEFAVDSSLLVHVYWPDQDLGGAAAPFYGTDADGQPWLWLRHSSLPTVQTLPLAVTGEATVHPSATRELAPFRSSGSAEKVLVLEFKSAFNMCAGTVQYVPSSVEYTRPGSDLSWLNEVGQAITTLPSVTLYPGGNTEFSIDIGNTWSWSEGFLVEGQSFHADISYDIRLAEEGFALATLPPPEPYEVESPNETEEKISRAEGKDTSAVDIGFRPGLWNAPGGDDPKGSYLVVWADRTRALAHAAAEDRRMVQGSKLIHLFGETKYPLEKSTLSLDLSFAYRVYGEEDPATEGVNNTLVSAGQLVLTPKTGFGQCQELQGLPAVTDLMGLNGAFLRDDGDDGHVTLGTLSAKQVSQNGGAVLKELNDQAGLTVSEYKQVSQNGGAVLKGLTRTAGVPDERGTCMSTQLLDNLALATLPCPLKIATTLTGTEELLLYFRDLPLNSKTLKADLSSAWYDEESGFDNPFNGLIPERNHHHGFSWSLSQNQEDAHIICGPLAFRPLALLKVTLDDERKPVEIEFEGRIALPLAEDTWDKLTMIPADGIARLILEEEETKGRYHAKLVVTRVNLPLTDPDAGDRFVPHLVADSIVLTKNTISVESARLLFALGPELIELDLFSGECKEDQCVIFGQGDKSTEESTKPGNHGTLGFLSPSVVLPIPKSDKIIYPKALVSVYADLRKDDVGLVLDENLDLAINGPKSMSEGSTKFILDKTEISVTLQLPEEPSDFSERDWLASWLTDRVLALDWKVREPTQALGGIDYANTGRGSVLATLQRSKTSIQFNMLGVEQRAVFPLTQKGGNTSPKLKLIYTEVEGKIRACLSGRIKLGDDAILHKIPVMEVNDEDSHWVAQVTSGPTFFTRTVDAVFEAALVDLKNWCTGCISLPARVDHKVQNGKADLCWSVHQMLRLIAAPKFSEELKTLAEDSDVSVLKYNLGESHSKHAVMAYLFRSMKVMPWGLNKSMIESLADHLAKADKLLIIDASAHHLASHPAPVVKSSARLVHLVLPAIAILGTADSDLITSLKASYNQGLKDQTKFRRPIDRSVTSGLPAPGVVQSEKLAARFSNAQVEARKNASDLATELLTNEDDLVTRPLFQGQTQRKNRKGEWVDSDQSYPWADVALRLSKLFFLVQDPTGQESKKMKVRMAYILSDAKLFKQNFLTDDLVTGSKKETCVTAEAYKKAWEKMGSDTAHLIPGPGVGGQSGQSERKEPLGTVVSLKAPTRDNRTLTEIARINATITGIKDTDDARHKTWTEWCEIVLARLAPWATHGLMCTDLVRMADSQPPLTKIILTPLVQNRRPVWQVDLDRGPQYPQPQCDEVGLRTEEAAPGLLDGFIPVATGAEILQSEAGDLPADGQTEVRLTATGAMSGFALATTKHRVLPLPESRTNHQGFWITDREVVAHRAFKNTLGEAVQSMVTPALPPNSRSGVPVALVPATGGPFKTKPTSNERHTTQVLPAYQRETAVGIRAGVLSARRMGIEEMTPSDTEGKVAVASASQTPLWMRTPRPVELGVNDRPRASSHEDAHMALSPEPIAILHDGAASTDGFKPVSSGLDRSPRSRTATTVKLISPKNGLIGSDWNQQIEIKQVDEFGEFEGDNHWNVVNAMLWIGGRKFVCNKKPKLTTNENLILSGFSEPVLDIPVTGGKPSRRQETAAEAINRLPDATPVTFLAVLSRGSIHRQLVFELLKTGSTNPLIETPIFLRFDDPAYNDRLSGIPRLNRTLINETSELLLLAERKEVRPSDYLEVALAIRSLDPNKPTEVKFSMSDNELKLEEGGKEHSVTYEIERRRPNEDAVVKLKDESSKDKTLRYQADFVSFPQQLYLKATGTPGDVALMPEDRITIIFSIGNKWKIKLRFDVVDAPSLPGNPSAYCLLQLDGSKDWKKDDDGIDSVLSAPLYARGAMPTMTELVDPKEMVRGVVRRRAIYYWRSFVPKSTYYQTRFALQKSGRTGASWLPSDLDAEWVALPKLGNKAKT